MRGAPSGPRAVLTVVAFVIGLSPAWARGGEPGVPPGACPGYVAHLRIARACLARGDRVAAAEELRQAEKALDSCIRGAAQGSAMAEASSFFVPAIAS